MNVKRFTAKSSRDALRLVREALGDDAVVLSTQPSAGGVEVLAVAPERSEPPAKLSANAAALIAAARAESALEASSAEEDAERLEMSTLSFQDYVRKRMLKRRRTALEQGNAPATATATAAVTAQPAAARINIRLDDDAPLPGGPLPAEPPRQAEPSSRSEPSGRGEPSSRGEPIRVGGIAASVAAATAEASFEATASLRRDSDLLAELRSVKGLIEERFGALAFMERLQRRPAEARLSQRLLDCGFSPALVRRLADGMKDGVGDENEWAAQILERNLHTAEAGDAIEDRGGVFALIGATGVGKTTTTAKIAAAFAAKHGAGNLGLITLDAYRVGAHEQLRAYGRILGVPVHTAHDRASLEDLLDLLSAKKMVLVDTAGMAQRDARTRELLEMLSHRSVQRLLVINAASQGETIEDVLIAYRASTCAGIVLSKLDEAVKLGPALDVAIRHKLSIVGVANGQRVPEDWHRLSASALVQRALRKSSSPAWRLDAAEMSLVFASAHGVPDHVAAA